MSNRKLVLDEHEGSILATVGQQGCDPYWRTFEGDLETVIPELLGFLKEAQEKWAANPLNPTYTPPKAEKKPAVEAAVPTAEPQKAEDLPLLSGTSPEQPAETQEEKPAEAPAETAAEPVATEPEKEPVAEAPAEAPKPGEVEYFLQDGRGPFDSVQTAMDAMGLDKATRPQHNRYDRLSTKMKEQIQRRPKS